MERIKPGVVRSVNPSTPSLIFLKVKKMTERLYELFKMLLSSRG